MRGSQHGEADTAKRVNGIYFVLSGWARSAAGTAMLWCAIVYFLHLFFGNSHSHMNILCLVSLQPFMLPLVQTVETVLGLWWMSLSQKPHRLPPSLKKPRVLQENAKITCLHLQNFCKMFPVASPRFLLLNGIYDFLKQKKAKARRLWDEAAQVARTQCNYFEQCYIGTISM